MGTVIGLTGGLGSGKSCVSAIMKEQGAYVIDADIIAREVVQKGSAALREIQETFGDTVINGNGELNRPVLRDMVFKDKTLLQKLNSIIHPRVIHEQNRRIQSILASDPRAVIVVDAPLLVEAGYHENVDVLIVVYIPESLQIERVMHRDGISRDEAVKRIGQQMSLEEKKSMADHVIDNSGTVQRTKLRVLELMESLKEKDF